MDILNDNYLITMLSIIFCVLSLLSFFRCISLLLSYLGHHVWVIYIMVVILHQFFFLTELGHLCLEWKLLSWLVPYITQTKYVICFKFIHGFVINILLKAVIIYINFSQLKLYNILESKPISKTVMLIGMGVIELIWSHSGCRVEEGFPAYLLLGLNSMKDYFWVSSYEVWTHIEVLLNSEEYSNMKYTQGWDY